MHSNHFLNLDKKSKTKWELQKLYGISLKQYSDLVYAQNMICAICKKEPKYHRLCVDHDHTKSTKDKIVIKGLLCQDCNMGIGKLGDNIIRLQKTFDYLAESNNSLIFVLT